MAFVGQTVAEDDLARAKVSQNTIQGRKIIEPHRHKVKEMYKHLLREARVWKNAYNALCRFFYNPNALFDIPDVISCRWNVEVEHRDMVAYFLKLVVH
jgi:hypothetical protein